MLEFGLEFRRFVFRVSFFFRGVYVWVGIREIWGWEGVLGVVWVSVLLGMGGSGVFWIGVCWEGGWVWSVGLSSFDFVLGFLRNVGGEGCGCGLFFWGLCERWIKGWSGRRLEVGRLGRRSVWGIRERRRSFSWGCGVRWFGGAGYKWRFRRSS